MIPIFIGGCPRSGTTLLGSLLGSHTKCIATPESQFKNHLLNIDTLDVSQKIRWINTIKKSWRFKIWNVNISNLGNLNVSDTSTLLTEIVKKYSEKEHKPKISYWVDHTPDNLNNIVRLKYLFPEAKFIHIVRDGRAIAASILNLDWGPNNIIRAGQWWMENISVGLAAEKYCKDVLFVKYENLIENTESELKRICEHIGLVYEEQMIQGKGFNVPQYTKNQHQLIGVGVTKNRKDAWKNKLTIRQIELFESTTNGLLESLGYELINNNGVREANTIEKTEYFLSAFKTLINNKIHFPLRRQKNLSNISPSN